MLSAVVVQNDSLLLLIQKFSFLIKTMRIIAWLFRLSNNCIKQRTKRSGPLTTEELQESTTTWIKRVQNKHSKDMKIEVVGNRVI